MGYLQFLRLAAAYWNTSHLYVSLLATGTNANLKILRDLIWMSSCEVGRRQEEQLGDCSESLGVNELYHSA